MDGLGSRGVSRGGYRWIAGDGLLSDVNVVLIPTTFHDGAHNLHPQSSILNPQLSTLNLAHASIFLPCLLQFRRQGAQTLCSWRSPSQSRSAMRSSRRPSRSSAARWRCAHVLQDMVQPSARTSPTTATWDSCTLIGGVTPCSLAFFFLLLLAVLSLCHAPTLIPCGCITAGSQAEAPSYWCLSPTNASAIAWTRSRTATRLIAVLSAKCSQQKVSYGYGCLFCLPHLHRILSTYLPLPLCYLYLSLGRCSFQERGSGSGRATSPA